MRVRLSGSTITAHGDSLTSDYVEFPGNEPLGFSTNWTVSGSAPTRRLVDPNGHEYSVELPTQTAPSPGGSGLTVDNGSDPPAAVTTLVAPGAVIAGDSATLLYMQLLGPFRVTHATTAMFDFPGALCFELGDGQIVLKAYALFSEGFALLGNQNRVLSVGIISPADGSAGSDVLVQYDGGGGAPYDGTNGFLLEYRSRGEFVNLGDMTQTVYTKVSSAAVTAPDTWIVATLDGGACDAGIADIYAIVATPAS